MRRDVGLLLCWGLICAAAVYALTPRPSLPAPPDTCAARTRTDIRETCEALCWVDLKNECHAVVVLKVDAGEFR